MSKFVRIKLIPHGPYFFSGERCARDSYFGKENMTQRSDERNTYFLKSNKLPSQTALFGILRYLGLVDKREDFSLSMESENNIGAESFDLLKEKQNFGRIRKISPLMLMDCDGAYYLPAPKNHKAIFLKKDDCVKHKPWSDFEEVETDRGKRLVPDSKQFDLKTWDNTEFINLSTGELAANLFQSCVRVGINRGLENNGYFKREEILLDKQYTFVFFAEVADDFQADRCETAVTIGQSKSVFAVEWTDNPAEPDLNAVMKYIQPETCTVNGKTCHILTAYAASDLFYAGDTQELLQHCAFVTGISKDFRVFTTAYETGAKITRRYKKHQEALRLFQAGTVFIFVSEQQRQEFIDCLHHSRCFSHATIAGFNNIIISE